MYKNICVFFILSCSPIFYCPVILSLFSRTKSKNPAWMLENLWHSTFLTHLWFCKKYISTVFLFFFFWWILLCRRKVMSYFGCCQNIGSSASISPCHPFPSHQPSIYPLFLHPWNYSLWNFSWVFGVLITVIKLMF